MDGFDRYVAKGVEQWRIPGLAVAVIKDGKVVHTNHAPIASAIPGSDLNPAGIDGLAVQAPSVPGEGVVPASLERSGLCGTLMVPKHRLEKRRVTFE